LRQSFDAIVFPDQPVNELVNGYTKGSMPEEFVGGLGERGAEALRDFAAAGGTLIFLNRSSGYASQHLGVKVTSVTEGVSDREFYAPGALLKKRTPLTLGLPLRSLVGPSKPAWTPICFRRALSR
jgi:hypothetical protein